MPSCSDESRISGLSLRQAALVAGITYLLNPVTFSEAYVMPRLISATELIFMVWLLGWGWRMREPEFLTKERP